MEDIQSKLLECLNKTKFGVNRGRPNVSGVDEELSRRYTENSNWGKKIMGNPCQSITLGLIRKRNRKKEEPRELTVATEKNLDLFSLCKKYIQQISPDFYYTTICINKNLVCRPHKDAKNDSPSLIVGLGDYEGGDLFIDGEKHNIRYNPIIFNGYKQEHWNNEITSGTKYSIIYYVGG